MINQDSINGYMCLGVDMSHFNEDGSDDVYTFGICKPIHILCSIGTHLPGQNTPNVYFQLIFQMISQEG